MCAKLLTCPLCSQPGFLTLDALRAGLISAATRPLVCPVCNEVLLGMDKLTIHLFSHTVDINHLTNGNIVHNNNPIPGNDIEADVFQEWNVSKTQLPGHTTEKCNNTSTMVLETHQNKNETIVEVSKTKVTVQPYCVNDIINLDTAQNNTQNANQTQSNRPEYQGIWIGNLDRCDRITKEIVPLNEKEPRPNVTEIIESNIEKHSKPKEIVVIDKEKESHFLTFPSAESITSCSCLKQTSDKRNLDNVKKTVIDDKVQSQNSHNENTLSLSKSFKIFNEKEKTERCDVCGFHFSDNNILILHKELVHTIDQKDADRPPEEVLKSYSCHLCSKVFKMRGSLMIHMRVAHTGYNSGTLAVDSEINAINDGYNCPTCGKKFRKEQHVIQHLKTHEGKQWECDVCSKMFTTKYFLKKHKRLHSGEMPYKCNICEKTFTFQQSYHKHRLYHKDDKPHTCVTCGRSFKELSTLHNHERIHTGEKPFACETCGKCFRQRVSYLVHRRIHTGVMPYKCALCEKSFRYKVSQRTHKCPARQSENITQQLPSLVRNLMQMSTTQDTNTVQYCESQSMEPIDSNRSTLNTSNNEDNKYVLVIDSQGHHILTKESTVSNEWSSNKIHLENDNINKSDNHDPCISDENKTENSNLIQPSNENTCVEIMNDLFSMVTTSNNGYLIASKMDQSTIFHNKGKDNLIIPYDHFTDTSKATQLNEIPVNVEQNYNCANNATNTLETINEESLKQLLHSINKK